MINSILGNIRSRFIFAHFALVVSGRIKDWANSFVSNYLYFKHNCVWANLFTSVKLDRAKIALNAVVYKVGGEHGRKMNFIFSLYVPIKIFPHIDKIMWNENRRPYPMGQLLFKDPSLRKITAGFYCNSVISIRVYTGYTYIYILAIGF